MGRRNFASSLNSPLNPLFSLLMLPLLLPLVGCSHVSYLWQAAKGQAALYNRERPIPEVLKDPTVSEITKDRLRLVMEMKQIVERELGVKATGNYNTFVDLKRPYVVWVVTAAPPFELQEKTWWFPIVGDVPYLGFFNEKDALEWSKNLQSEGYDTYVRGAPAYSTLGYLRDPILSSMIYYRGTKPVSDGHIANLVFHETTHTHLYIAGQTGFNEAAASFIGEYGEKLYLSKRFGVDSPAVKRWHERRVTRRREGNELRQFAEDLKIFYKKAETLSLEERLAGKKALFDRIKNYSNNADVLAHLAYEDDQDLFDSVYEKCGQSVRRSLVFLQLFAQRFEKLRQEKEGAKKTLTRFVASGESCPQT